MIWGFWLLHHNLTVTYFCDHLVCIMLGIRAGIGVEVDTKNKDCSACRMLKGEHWCKTKIKGVKDWG